MPRAAVIGCGDVSVVHFEALAALDQAELVAVCDTDPASRTRAAEKYSVPGYADHLTLIEAARPDVVHICTPHDQHAAVAIDCLQRGVNVVLEKPLAHTSAAGDGLVDVAERSSAKIAICFQNRYNTAVAAMHGFLSTGELGPVRGAAATVPWHRTADYYRSRPWRGTWAGGGGGLLMNQAIHTVDLLQWLMGDVTRVSGHAATRVLSAAIEVEDTAEFVLDHSSGARSTFYATLANAVNAPITVDVVTDKASLSLRGDLTITHADGRIETVAERQATSQGRTYWGISHQLLIADFYSRLHDEGPFWIDPREARKSLDIVKQVYRQSYPDATDVVA